MSIDTWISLAGILAAVLALWAAMRSSIGALKEDLKRDIARLETKVDVLDHRVYELNTHVSGLLAREQTR